VKVDEEYSKELKVEDAYANVGNVPVA